MWADVTSISLLLGPRVKIISKFSGGVQRSSLVVAVGELQRSSQEDVQFADGDAVVVAVGVGDVAFRCVYRFSAYNRDIRL